MTILNSKGRTPWKTRKDATAFLNELGVPTGDKLLDNLATKGDGPVYSIINGRALYQEADLLAWIEAQAKQSPEQASQRGRTRTPKKIIKQAAAPKREARRAAIA
jgi:hypothetical protein